MDDAFDIKNLGAIGADLSALSNFFDPPWRQTVATLSEGWKGWILNVTGFNLRAMGWLLEASQPMRTSLEAAIAEKEWKRAARRASNLSELYLTIGDVTHALIYAEQSVELADLSGAAFERMVHRVRYADCLHQAYHLSEALSVFREAEEMQKKTQPEFPLLYSKQGFEYCNLLLSQDNYAEVQRRAAKALEIVLQGSRNLLDIALNNLSLGRAHLLKSQREPNHPFTESANYLNRAVDGLRQARQQDELPRGLLARAEFYRVTGALDKAKRDLDEAFSIATRGGMGLHLADCHLEYARLAVVQPLPNPPLSREERVGSAREHLATAKEMIEKMGYHRRDKEVEELEREILDHETRESTQ